MAVCSWRALIELADVNHNLPIGIQTNVRSIHWSRRWTLKIPSFSVVATSMAWALELIFTLNPIGGATQVGTLGVDYEDPLGIANYPNPILLLKPCVDSETKVGRITDSETCFRFKKCPGKEKAHGH